MRAKHAIWEVAGNAVVGGQAVTVTASTSLGSDLSYP